MFDNQPAQNLDQGSSAAQPPDIWGEVHSMPSSRSGWSAAPGGVAPPPPKASKRWLIVAIVVVLLGIGGVASYLAFFAPQPPPALPVTPAPVPAPTPEPTPPAPVVPAPLATATARDDRRYLDVRTIQGGLELYYATNKRYPLAPLPLALGLASTKVLSDAGFTIPAQGRTYLGEVPQNPTPGAADYLYESLDGTTYAVTFRFEEGAAGLNAGEHKAQPQGIDGVGTIMPPPELPRQLQLPAATVDGDGDGLTDAEEPLFGTDPALLDTDGDTYADGREVTGGFDPALSSGALLAASPRLATFTSTKFGYAVRYPTAWLAKAVDQEEAEVILSGAEGEFIEVLIVDNPEQLTAEVWYAKQVPGLSPTDVPTLVAGTTTWALSFDGLNAYLASGSHLITLSYNIGTRTEASFYQLFQAIVKLFQPPQAAASVAVPGGGAEGTTGGSQGDTTNAPPQPGS